MTEHLKFETEKGASRSKWVAAALVIAIVGWMASPYITPKPEPVAAEPVSAREQLRPVTVAVAQSAAQPVTDMFTAEGQAVAKRDTAIRTETGGTIAEVLVEKGDDVAEGAVVARIDAAQREADLARTLADEAQARRAFDNAKTLLDRGVATQDRLTQARAGLAAAEAGVANAREAMGNLDITAPFGGRIEALALEAGEFVGAGQQVGRLVDLDPLTVSVQVPQKSLSSLKVGQQAEVSFITGDVRRGEVSYISSTANAQTRTFNAEIVVPNPKAEIAAGLSAKVRIPTGEKQAHFLSPAILSLGTDGGLGIKAVGEGNHVDFYPVTIIRAQTDGVWVGGLPDELTLITIGQGFVNAGELVDPQPAELLDVPDRNVGAKTDEGS